MLGEIENYALNLPMKNKEIFMEVLKEEPLMKTEKFNNIHEVIDIIQFGHLLFEMGTGCELSTLRPEPNDYIYILG